jgi:hypothetical protein
MGSYGMRNSVLLAVSAATVAGLVLVAAYAPRCEPGDTGLYIGGMLIGGCKERDITE